MEERLRKFATLVELGSFTKAAESLHISQPALSTSIKKLERELKELLLVRGAQPLALTPAGQHAYTTAKELSVSTSNLMNKLDQLRRQKPTISIGMIDSVVAEAVFDNGAAFSELERNSHFSLIVDNSRNLLEEVRRGRLDLAFIVEPSMHAVEESLEYSPIGPEPLIAVCSRQELPTMHTTLARGSLSPFISYNRSSHTYRLIAQAYTRARIRLRPTFYSTSPSVMLQLVTAGRGASVLPYLLVKDMLKSNALCSLPVEGDSSVIDRPIVCIAQRGRDLPSSLTAAMAEVKDMLRLMHQAAHQIDK